ncbi:hypothetical protein ACTQ33_15120 [Candidatus Avoscillospira sp. LCP25S3_F1]|uniref:hypothetical protein n=1 Tax=Candidatus Avoscillospira sp. LCP25S3_F1 TaxID=3438825 RepID=UPI003F9097FC
MERSALEELEQSLKTKKKKRKRSLLLLLLLLLLIAGGIVAWRFWPQPKSQYELDADALAGFLSTHTQEEIEEELNRIIDKGRFNISINPTVTVQPDGMANFMIENVPANHYWMQVTIYYQDTDGTERELYRSGMIQQGYFIEDAEITGDMPSPGTYNARAVFRAVQPESDEEIGQSVATMVVQVLE